MCLASEATREAKLLVKIVVLARESSAISLLVDRVRKACLTLTRIWRSSPSGRSRTESCSAGHHLKTSLEVLHPLSWKVFCVARDHASFLWDIILADATVSVFGHPTSYLGAHRDSLLEKGLLRATILHFRKRRCHQIFRARRCTHQRCGAASSTSSCRNRGSSSIITNLTNIWIPWDTRLRCQQERARRKSRLAKFRCY